jgi:hypothetical protein
MANDHLPPASGSASDIQFAYQDEIPQIAQLTFSIHAQIPAAFSGQEKVEVATVHGAYLATLTPNNSLTLEDSQVALATLDTGKAFASSASGPLRFRVIEGGIASDWLPLATLVRLPAFRDLKCPDAPDQPCELTGSKLFLVDSVSNDPQFDHPTQVPEGFPGYVLPVPHPIGRQLYVKLHDHPSIVNSVGFPAEGMPTSAAVTSAASQEVLAPSSNSPAIGAQASPSTGTSARPTAAKQDAAAPPLSKPSATSGSSPASASAPDNPAPPSTLRTPPPAVTNAPQSGGGATPP